MLKRRDCGGIISPERFLGLEPISSERRSERQAIERFQRARVEPIFQVKLVTKSGKMAATLEGSDYEFVNKVEFQKIGDEFATA